MLMVIKTNLNHEDSLFEFMLFVHVESEEMYTGIGHNIIIT